ncbi:glutathione S-transferase family protein [Oceanicoccus sagamiensis]|uniref:Glutathione S-transferase n=1 Tax=Oceanicoccus sagamiensis TaxID=716816 RepID=A0A1X9NA94_9GAMM|nr:glutathione S-transferase family protein [Oceanicoccus sagamiensis]ARN74546.1 hypothetical protein BST96_10685 [Oceanicoccus sagamiensis]
MVLLAKEDIRTTEVFEWQGIHLLHFSGSTCSKKIRIMLDIKEIDWTSHPINLIKRENNSDWFMGINPRGLVPVLVHDGAVHIESNDILNYLEKMKPEPSLMPIKDAEDLGRLLQLEDELHIDLRNITLRFTAPSKLMQRSKEQLVQYESAGTGTIGGSLDSHKKEELEYWQQFSINGGVTDAQVITSCKNFQQALDGLDFRLEKNNYLLGENISMADIAWFVTINRIVLAGYPLQQLHPRLAAWLRQLLQMPAFSKEAKAPLVQVLASKLIRMRDALRGKTLNSIVKL